MNEIKIEKPKKTRKFSTIFGVVLIVLQCIMIANEIDTGSFHAVNAALDQKALNAGLDSTTILISHILGNITYFLPLIIGCCLIVIPVIIEWKKAKKG